MIDIDKSFQYSKIISLNIKEENDFYIFPNPVTETLKIRTISSSNTQSKYAKIYNITGKIIDNLVINDFGLDVSHLSFGIYFLKLENGTLHRFMKE